MKLVDFKIDMEELRGQKVAVPGIIKFVNDDTAFLSLDESISAMHVWVGIKKLPRELRMLLVTKCTSGCSAIVRGKVGKEDFAFMNGILAENFEVVQ